MSVNQNTLKLQRIVMEVFGGCNYTCQMCPQSNPGRGKNFTRKMPIKEFEKILDEVVPKYGKPIINLEGSGEPTMAKDLPKYIDAVRVDQKLGQISIKSTSDYKWLNKDKLRVEIAADNLAGNGNPFSDYSIFDFDLSNCRLTKEEGCTVTSSKENKIEFEPYQNDFEIVIEGLYPKWAYIQKTIFINQRSSQ